MKNLNLKPKLKIAGLIVLGYLLAVIITPTALGTKTKNALTKGCNVVFQHGICKAVALGSVAQAATTPVATKAIKSQPIQKQKLQVVERKQAPTPRPQAYIQAAPSKVPTIRQAQVPYQRPRQAELKANPRKVPSASSSTVSSYKAPKETRLSLESHK